MSYCFPIPTLKKNSMNFLILVSFFFLNNLNGQVADNCKLEMYNACRWQLSEMPPTPTAANCIGNLQAALSACQQGEKATGTVLTNAFNAANNITASTVDTAGGSMATGSVGAGTAGGFYGQCSSSAKTASSSCASIKLAPSCTQYQSEISAKCDLLAKEAGASANQQGMLSKAGDALKSNWKPLLIGAAVGAGAMALMGGKKGGDGGGTPPPASKPDDKLPDLKLNGSTTSAAPTPSVVYYPPSNNNGSLGNPAVIGSTTSTSTPADTVKVAGITPSTSFASGQGSSLGPDTSSRTISSSGSATPASTSEGSLGSTDSGGGVFGGGSDSASLVDTSGKSAGGGGGFSGGMDGGSGSSAQAASADGTMLTGIPGGKNDPQSAKVKALASKKAKVAQTQSRTTIPKPFVRRRLATPPVKAAPAVNLKQDMRARGLIK